MAFSVALRASATRPPPPPPAPPSSPNASEPPPSLEHASASLSRSSTASCIHVFTQSCMSRQADRGRGGAGGVVGKKKKTVEEGREKHTGGKDRRHRVWVWLATATATATDRRAKQDGYAAIDRSSLFLQDFRRGGPHRGTLFKPGATKKFHRFVEPTSSDSFHTKKCAVHDIQTKAHETNP